MCEDQTDVCLFVSFPGSSEGNSSSIDSNDSPSAPTTPDVHTLPIHKLAATANVNKLYHLIVNENANVNEAMKDGTTPVHTAAESGNEGL